MQTAPLIEAAITPASILAPLVAPQAPRARAFIDGSRLSATYGCADRAYWYYRTLTNFAGATWQQVALALAALFKTPDNANPWAGDAETLEAAAAALSFWARMGHGDGAVDEWYLNEHSYCPTAINGAGAAMTLDLIGPELSAARQAEAAQALRMTGDWLQTRYNPTVMNQNLAAAVALAGVAKAEGGEWRARAEAKLGRVRADQSAEGWFPEYEGADLGYSTLALDLLAAYHKLSGAEMAQEMGAALCAFLLRVQGGWRSFAGRLGSRGTSHVFPYGALYFAERGDANAAALAQTWLEGLRTGAAPSPAGVDDRYFAYFYLPQFALAYHQAARMRSLRAAPPAPPEQGDFPDSGFVALKRSGWSALISRRLGGALAVSGDGGPIYHCGYEVRTRAGKRFSSAVWSKDAPPPLADNALTVGTDFQSTSSGVPLKTLMAPFQFTVGLLRSSAMAEAFQGFIKTRMIAPKGGCGLKLERRIDIAPNGLRIRDVLTPAPGFSPLAGVDIARAVSMHSPSARQDQARLVEIGDTASHQVCAALNAGRTATLDIIIEGATGAARVERVS